jgi:hypothetical protein
MLQAVNILEAQHQGVYEKPNTLSQSDSLAKIFRPFHKSDTEIGNGNFSSCSGPQQPMPKVTTNQGRIHKTQTCIHSVTHNMQNIHQMWHYALETGLRRVVFLSDISSSTKTYRLAHP